MRADIKTTGLVYSDAMRDLARPHPFAAERIGFGLGRATVIAPDKALVFLTQYHPILDEHYVPDPTVGARIGTDALTWAMQAAYHGRAAREGIFHIHMHHHYGETGLSKTDHAEIPKMIPGFQSVGREAPHGIIIFSLNHAAGWVWLPKMDPINVQSISVMGSPIEIFERGSRA